ncbi:MAG: WecB/TagA/CpsF family glycosyltransferase [Victivallaceae bacterium]|nr:WecB/TagA/CpsF family glycosyltransferase [Victivallaceae bacterium]
MQKSDNNNPSELSVRPDDRHWNPDAPSPKCVMLGMAFDRLDFDASVERILAMARCSEGACKTASTVNVDFIVRSLCVFSWRARHPELLAMLRECDFVCADGMPLVWLSRLLGIALPCRVTGADLVPALAAGAAEEGIGIYILGGEEEKTRKAVAILQKKHPSLIVSGMESPYVKLDDEAQMEQIIGKINASGAKLLFLALGNPKQEQFLRRARTRLTVNFAVGVGGTFNFIAGDVRRAPEWVRHSGLEWIYRILQEPGRLWKRYAAGLPKISILALEAVLCCHLTRLFVAKRARLSEEELLLLVKNGTCRADASRIQLYGARLLDRMGRK